MLESVKIQRRQSEIRQALAMLAAKEQPSADETRQMDALDAEYRANETRYRAALIAEDSERREAGRALETRATREWSDLVERFELRQVALHLDEHAPLTGPTAEVVSEMRGRGGYRGVPVPWLALERREGETVAGGVPDPTVTRPILDRLFPDSVAGRMGAQMIAIDSGSIEWPVVTAGASVAWQASELGSVGAPSAFVTTDKPLKPDHTLGVQMKITRRALKQSGDALEAAIRRDMNAALGAEMDRAVFLGAGTAGEPLGVVIGAGSYGIATTAVDAPASWAAFRGAVTGFLQDNAAAAPGAVRVLIDPLLWDFLDGVLVGETATTEYDRLTRHIPASNIVMSSHALPDPGGDSVTPPSAMAVLTVASGGVAPIFVGTWGGIDLIRDPYSDAATGGLRITALATMDVTVARPVQLRLLTGLLLTGA